MAWVVDSLAATEEGDEIHRPQNTYPKTSTPGQVAGVEPRLQNGLPTISPEDGSSPTGSSATESMRRPRRASERAAEALQTAAVTAAIAALAGETLS
eukprot:1691165-Pleurochrysis_carterae.AAC.5